MFNYLPDVNRFALAGPPRWFLKQLFEFDPDLVIIPSRQGFYYRLAIRRKLQLPEHIVNDSLWNESDTQMLASYQLVPVTTIVATCNWSNPLIFQELKERCPSKLGGHAKVIKHIEDQERMKELKAAEAADDFQTRIGRDAWNMYLKKVGLKSHAFVAPRQKAQDHEKFRASTAASPGILIKG